MLRKTEFEKSDFLWRVSVSVTIVSGLFVVLVFVLLVVNYLQVRSADPINNLLITELRDQYASAPERDEALAERIRDLDLLTRKAFFTSQYHLRVGGLLLLAGVIVFLISFKNMARWKPDVPELTDTPPADLEWLSYATSRQLITWVGVAVLAGGLLASYMTESVLVSDAASLPNDASGKSATAEAPPDVATDSVAQSPPNWDEVVLHWPSLRGPGGCGVAHYTTAPLEWDVQAGAGIRWKATVPRAGANSPVVWGGRLYVTGADAENRDVYCYDTESGDLLWQQTLERLPGTPDEAPDVTEDTGYAAPTMAAHGDQVFALFANGDIVSYDSGGTMVWGRGLGMPVNHYGHSSSLLAYEDLLYVQYDDNENPRLMALDVQTGEEVWVAQREKISWASPILAHTPFGPQVILCSEVDVDAYDPIAGTLIWSQECLGGEVAPSAAYASDIVFAANEYAVGSAVRLSGTADAVQSEILWQWDELLPEVSSPVGDGENFYFGTAFGDFVCLDAETGEEVWVQETDEGFYSSPVLVGDRIYILGMEGTMFIFKAGPEYELIATCETGEPTFATPAYLDGRIYLRTFENLYCIE